MVPKCLLWQDYCLRNPQDNMMNDQRRIHFHFECICSSWLNVSNFHWEHAHNDSFYSHCHGNPFFSFFLQILSHWESWFTRLKRSWHHHVARAHGAANVSCGQTGMGRSWPPFCWPLNASTQNPACLHFFGVTLEPWAASNRNTHCDGSALLHNEMRLWSVWLISHLLFLHDEGERWTRRTSVSRLGGLIMTSGDLCHIFPSEITSQSPCLIVDQFGPLPFILAFQCHVCKVSTIVIGLKWSTHIPAFNIWTDLLLWDKIVVMSKFPIGCQSSEVENKEW